MNRRMTALLVVVMALISLTTGCTTTPAVRAPAPPRAAELTILVRGSDEAVDRAVSDALAHAGYRLAPAAQRYGRPQDRVAVDLTLDIALTTKDARYGIVEYKGAKDYKGSAQAAGADGAVLDSLDIEFTSAQLGPDDFNELVNRINASRAVGVAILARDRRVAEAHAVLARAAAEARAAEETARLAAEAAAASKRAAELDAWTHSSSGLCAAPQRGVDCDGVSTFAQQFPGAEHATEARALLAASAVRISELRDDEAWELADAPSCRKPKAEDACAALRNYLSAFEDTARHFADARKALGEGEPLCARLRVAREAKEARETARAEAIAAANDSSSSSSSGYGGGGYGGGSSSRGSGGSVQVRSYTRANGTVVQSHTRSSPGSGRGRRK